MKKTSLPTREVWIEIVILEARKHLVQSLPTREVWIEITAVTSEEDKGKGSLPTREVWIEIRETWKGGGRMNVTSYAGSVD